ncbi:Imm52 family immunity protein [Zobellia uliginosa]|uniref:Imm52 family immunity protein n=1 Tax=Zobellia uliginosa TaxID=143224 RepID=UPI001C07969F|nr:Imm52 family immunity protein [Zobellia uliginosa]MBU2946292.1 immunity 52 family protein [Zobellia uliginosa]
MREEIFLKVQFKSRRLTLQEYLNFSKTVLKALQPIHPIFENMCSWGFSADAWCCFDNNLKDFDNVVFEQLKDEELAFINEDKLDKELRYQSYSHIGFSNAYSNTKNEKDGKVSVTISDGKGIGNGFINIEFPQWGYDIFCTDSFCTTLMKVLINLTNAEYSVIVTDTLYDNVDQINDEFWVGWITYFSNKEVLKYLPKRNDIIENNLFDGALFIIDTDKPCNMGEREISIAKEIKERLELSKLL